MHFEASRKNPTVEYQYGDWLKAANGRNKSPPRRRNATWVGESPLEKEVHTGAAGSGVQADETVAARVSPINDDHNFHYGKDEINGNIPRIQEDISPEPLIKDSKPLQEIGGASVSCSNKVSSNGPKANNMEMGQAQTKPDSTKKTWTRITRMEVGPVEKSLNTQLSKLGKRQLENALEKNDETKSTLLHQKRSRVSGGGDFSESISAGVEGHPCRKP